MRWNVVGQMRFSGSGGKGACDFAIRFRWPHSGQQPISPAIFSAGISDTRDKPSSLCANKVEQIRPTVVHFAIHQKLEWSPRHVQIVINPNQRIVNSLLDLSFAGFSNEVRKSLKRHPNCGQHPEEA